MARQRNSQQDAAMKTASVRAFRFGVMSDTIAELKRVSWPSRDQAVRQTGIVIAVSTFVGALLVVIDWAMSQAFDVILV
jgi:preprotein translocase SecE subunit|tara:strand:- start:519 stop:755 length:237 start_codon:yes stop_codon:yes gene_type:complete